jgi:hypothetical protein
MAAASDILSQSSKLSRISGLHSQYSTAKKETKNHFNSFSYGGTPKASKNEDNFFSALGTHK